MLKCIQILIINDKHLILVFAIEGHVLLIMASVLVLSHTYPLTFPGTKDLACAFCASYHGQGFLDGADGQFGYGPE